MRLAFVFALLAAPALAQDVENPLQPSELWDDMRESVIGTNQEPPVNPAVLLLDAPKRADNPALVPIHITQPPGAPDVTALSLVVDGNPAPVASPAVVSPAAVSPGSASRADATATR